MGSRFLISFFVVVAGSMFHQGLAGQVFPPTSPITAFLITTLANYLTVRVDPTLVDWTTTLGSNSSLLQSITN
jgi:hypothetical protein